MDKVIDKIKNTWDDVSDTVHGSHFLTPNGEIIGNYNHNTMVTDLAPMIDGFELTGKTIRGGGRFKNMETGEWYDEEKIIEPHAGLKDITNFLAHTGFVRATNEGSGESGYGHTINLTVNGTLTSSQIREIQRMEYTSGGVTTLNFDIYSDGDETQSGHGTFRDFMKAYRNNYGTEAFQELEHPRDGDGKFADKDGADTIKNVRVDINKSILQGQIDYLLSNFEEESQDYKPFQKVSDEDRSIRYRNQKVREEIELLKDEINSPELEGLPVIKEEPNTHEVKVFKNGFALDTGERLLSYKDVVGFKSNTTDITIDNFTDGSRFGLTEKQAEKQIETIRLVWNQLPDKLRDTVKHFKIERTPELMHDPDDETKWLNEHDTMIAGSWMPYKLSDGKPNNVTEAGTLTMRIDERRTSHDIKGTLTHECGHVRYHNIKDSNPEKIKKWEKVAKGSPPTSYSKYHKDRWIKATKSVEKQRKRNFSATQSVEIDGEWREVPWIEMYGDDYIAMTVEERKHMLESNEKIREELYYNELHSEVHMYMMNRTDKKLKSKTGKITKNMDRFVNAYKELHGL